MITCTGLARAFTLGMAVGLLMAAVPATAQQAYPNKPIRIIVPYAPGGTTDLLARLLGPKLTERWGQQVIAENRPGGNTIIGSEALVKSKPDGYTFMFMSSTFVTTSLLAPIPFDAIKDFTPVTSLVSSEFVFAIHASVPANNLQEFITLAKSKPGQLNYASSGAGGITHLAMELFNMTAGTKMNHIPYKGTGPAIADLAGGQVQAAINDPPAVIPHIKSGKLKGIAVTGQMRMASLPQVPTFAEAGLPKYDIRLWYGVLAPAGTPKAIIDKFASEMAKILVVPETKEKLMEQGLTPFISSPEQFGALIKADMAKFANVIKTANIKLDN